MVIIMSTVAHTSPNPHPGFVRLAEERDIPHIFELIATNADHLLPRTVEGIRELLPFTYVVEEAGSIVGSAILEIYSPKIAEIRSLVVRSDMRGRGYGKLLVEAAVAEAKARKIHEILVVTASPKFFEQLNFGSCLNERYALFYDGKSQ